nr:TlpA disulfide reductase family protein [uncultured Prevotella sp.]
MNNIIKSLSLLSIIWASSAIHADAQMVKGVIADTTLSKRAYIVYNPEKGGSQFDGVETKLEVDAKGQFTFDAKKLGDRTFCPAFLYLGDNSEHQFMLTPGSTLNIKVNKKDGKPQVSFSGKYADASYFMKHYGEGYDFDLFFPYGGKPDLLKGQDRKQVLEEKYQALVKEVKKVKNEELRQFLTQLNEDGHNNFLLRLLPKGSSEKKELLSKVDVNNWIGLYNYLPQWKISASVDAKLDSLFGHDMTEHGLAYLKLVKEKVTDPVVRHALLDECASETLNYGKDFADIDRFWKPYCEMAASDSSLINKYANKVAAIKRIKKGKMAPDFTFSDRDGKGYRLSDMRGKVVYIDCWATWCGPCCKEIPFLEKRVAEYKGNDKVRFISISLDNNKQAWLKKLDKDKPEWEQFIVSKEEHKALSKAYGITGIPRFLIINADGTIADGDAFRPSEENFHEKLDAILNK